MLKLPKGAKMLDAGCGAGVPVASFLSQYFEVTGVDFAEEQIQLAQQLVPNARFLCQDMTKLDFPDKTFDAICSYYAIIHIPREEHKKLLQDFHRILKPSGLVLLCMGIEDIPSDVSEDYFGTTMYWSHFNADINLKMLKECGFNIIWHKRITDCMFPSSAHLFILAEKS